MSLVPQTPLIGEAVLVAEQLAVEPLPLPRHCQDTVEPAAGKDGLVGLAVPDEQRVEDTGQAVTVLR